MLKSLDISKLNQENLLFHSLKKQRIINIKEPFKRRAEKKKKEKIKIFSDKKLISEQEGLDFLESHNQIESFADTLKKISPFIYYQTVTRNQNRFSTRPSDDVRRGSCFGFPTGNSPTIPEEKKWETNFGDKKLELQVSKSGPDYKEKKAEVEFHRLMGLPDIPALEFKNYKKGLEEEEFKGVANDASSRRLFQRKSDSKVPANRKKMIFGGLGDLQDGSEEDFETPHKDFPRRFDKTKTMEPTTKSRLIEKNIQAFEIPKNILGGGGKGKLHANEFQGDVDKSPYTSPIRDKKRIFADDMQTSKFLSDKKRHKLYNQKVADLKYQRSEHFNSNAMGEKIMSKGGATKTI